MTQHPSDDIAAHIDSLFFISLSLDDEEKTEALQALTSQYQALAKHLVEKVCACGDREAALRSLRGSFSSAASAIVHEVKIDPWTHSPAPND